MGKELTKMKPTKIFQENGREKTVWADVGASPNDPPKPFSSYTNESNDINRSTSSLVYFAPYSNICTKPRILAGRSISVSFSHPKK